MCVLIYPVMRESKWGNSLAARLPSVVVIARDRKKERALDSIRRLARPLPPGFAFDRE